jgi:hypothetical protein
VSLQLRSSYTVPEETARVTRAAFPKGKAYLRLHEELGALYTDEMCSRLFPSQGQPAESPARSAFGVVVVRLYLEPAVVLVQQADDLSADIRAAGVLEECPPLERRLGKGGKLRANKLQIQARLCVHGVLRPIPSWLSAGTAHGPLRAPAPSPGSQVGSHPPSPLRTTHATFTARRSSLTYAPERARS